MILNDYELINETKADRALNGTVTTKGQLTGGVGKEASDDAKLAEYDRLGGLIKFKGDIVAKGSFYDFAKRMPRETPQVMLQFSINGKTVLVPADQELPPLVRAAKAAEQGEALPADTPEETVSKSSSLIGGGKHKRSKKDEDTDA